MQKPMKVLSVFGTRPEAIKMAPVVRGLAANPQAFQSVVCVTAQHRDMLDQVLNIFEIQPDYDLNVMRPNQDLFQVTTNVLMGIKPILEEEQPDMVLVQGDTTTTMAVSLACFYLKIPVGHIEAGLRTHNMHYPFPEEMNRVVTDAISTLYFPPTQRSQQHLLDAGVPAEKIILTGNTVIDALLYTLKQSKENPATDPAPYPIQSQHRLVLVTVHRRENFGEPLREICMALQQLVTQHRDIELVIPVHPNPNVQSTVQEFLADRDRVHLISPLEYEPFCQLMDQAHLVLTDSGGVQEEAPSLSKPVLVLRDETERPEAVEMGTVKLVGPHFDAIVSEAHALLTDPIAYQAMAKTANPYGDGHATERILGALQQFHQQQKSNASQQTQCNEALTSTSS